MFNSPIDKFGSLIWTLEKQIVFFISCIKFTGIDLQIFLYSLREHWILLNLFLNLVTVRFHRLYLICTKIMPWSKQSWLNKDFLFDTITLLFHKVAQWGVKLWVNTIFQWCKTCLWNSDNLKDILEISKSHFKRKFIPPNLLKILFGMWNHWIRLQ